MDKIIISNLEIKATERVGFPGETVLEIEDHPHYYNSFTIGEVERLRDFLNDNFPKEEVKL